MFSDHLFWCLHPCAPCGETPQYFRSEPTDSTERRPGQVGPVVSQAAAFLTAGHWANSGFWYCQKTCPASRVHVPEGAAGSGGSISPICFVVTLDSSLPSLKKLNPDWCQPTLPTRRLAVLQEGVGKRQNVGDTTNTPSARISRLGRGKPGAVFFAVLWALLQVIPLHLPDNKAHAGTSHGILRTVILTASLFFTVFWSRKSQY